MPVLNHDVHESTKKSANDPYGCRNRKMKRGYYVKERLYSPSGTFSMINQTLVVPRARVENDDFTRFFQLRV